VSVTALRRRLERLRIRGAAPDAGVSLIEVMVAMLLFAVVSSGVIAMLNLSVKETRDGRNRVQAAQLAGRELEIARNQFGSGAPGAGPESLELNAVTNPSPLNAGAAAGAPLVVDGTPYTVVRTARWAGSDTAAGVAPCDSGGSGKLTYLHVRVSVTWPQMGSTPPVVSDTILTPPNGIFSGTTNGHVGVKVVGSTGAAQAGITVTVTKPGFTTRSGTTSADGCAVFAFLPPDNYTVTLSSPGPTHVYVDDKRQTASAHDLGVTAGTMQRRTFSYDQAAALRFEFRAPAGGYALPAAGLDTLPVKLFASFLQPNGFETVTGSGSPLLVSPLFPSDAGYGYSFDTCTGSTPMATVEARPAATTTVTHTLEPTAVTVTRESDGVVLQNAQVIATQVVDTGCAAAATVTLGSTDAAGRLMTSLPAGRWVLSVSGQNPGATGWPEIALPSGGTNFTVGVA
jgi:prepilin-type N-terminal cleavage/methylation domain-containing protein